MILNHFLTGGITNGKKNTGAQQGAPIELAQTYKG
jgi:hypothetical protein